MNQFITSIKAIVFPSVDSISRSMNKQVAKLKKLADQKEDEANSISAKADNLLLDAAACMAEAERADRVARRWQEFLA